MPASEKKAIEQKKLPGIFISYRRSDNPDATGRIYDRLVQEFGKARVFKDVDSIPLGQDFRGHLNEVVGGCAVVLAIIGPRWTDARNSAGQRRLEDADDFVRIELEAALARDIPVVPVLVAHAAMPGTPDLPASLASMVFRQSIEVRPDPDFHNDATRLVLALQRILDPNAPIVAAQSNRRSAWAVAFAAGVAVAAAALGVPALKQLRAPSPLELRTDIVTPATDQPFEFALSPDGRAVAFIAKGDGPSRLWLRSLGAASAQPLPGTEGASHPFWSPDSRSLGFFASASLKRVDIGGGQPQVLAPVRADGTLAGSWSTKGVILFGEGQTNTLRSVSATGGKVTDVLAPNSERGWISEPHFLPDGQQFLFLSRVGIEPGLYLSSLEGRTPVRLTGEADFAPVAYLPSGWVLWSRSGALTAQRLDLKSAALTGQLQTLAENSGSVSASMTGMVAYKIRTSIRKQFSWVDRLGTSQPFGNPDFSLSSPRVAPDGRRVAYTQNAQGIANIWLLDGVRASRMTFDRTPSQQPIWSYDGSKIVYSAIGPEGVSIYQKASSGAGEAQLLLSGGKNSLANFATSWSADGRFMLYFGVDQGSAANLWVLPLAGDRTPILFLGTPSVEAWGQFSPDGKWVAYQSDESGQNEIYVRPFVEPGKAATGSAASGGQWLVSSAGGIHPMWGPDGKEIYYVNPAGEMMATPIAVNGSAIVPGATASLFHVRIAGGGLDRTQGRQYDVAPDGRFLVNVEIDSGEAAPVTLIQNWNPE